MKSVQSYLGNILACQRSHSWGGATLALIGKTGYSVGQRFNPRFNPTDPEEVFYRVCTHQDRGKVIHRRAILRSLSAGLCLLPPRNSYYLAIGSGVVSNPPIFFLWKINQFVVPLTFSVSHLEMLCSWSSIVLFSKLISSLPPFLKFFFDIQFLADNSLKMRAKFLS